MPEVGTTNAASKKERVDGLLSKGGLGLCHDPTQGAYKGGGEMGLATKRINLRRRTRKRKGRRTQTERGTKKGLRIVFVQYERKKEPNRANPLHKN